MLLLGRKIGQRIIIADNIIVTILAIHGNRVQIGVEADKSVNVRREEVKESNKGKSHV